LPIVPGLGVHHRLGVERAGIEIVWIFFPERAHRVGIGRVQLGAVGFGIGRVAQGKRIDPVALLFARVALQCDRILQHLPGRLDGVVLHGKIDVRAQRKGDAPPAHRTMGIEPCRLAEGADRLGVIESEIQPDSLIEEKLRPLVLRGDLMVVGAEPLEQRRARLVRFAHIDGGHRVDHLHGHGGHCHRLVGGSGTGRHERNRERYYGQTIHGFLPRDDGECGAAGSATRWGQIPDRQRQYSRAMTTATAQLHTLSGPRRIVAFWLLTVAAVILAMITVGGLTRITGSGLSITEWDPIMGAVPPISDAAWQDAFSKYQRIPQYLHEHAGMTLDDFKGIYWWEWAHRLLGRLLGVIFFVPFVLFAWIGAIRRAEWPRMLLLFALGGLQGFIGWWMVESGLETRVSVSQYRLAIHLGTAIILLGAILWIALEYLRDLKKPKQFPRRAVGMVALVYCPILLGALVAGLHAGLLYNTWPDMNGRVFPEGAFAVQPWWLNPFENPGLAQFDHRIGAYIVAVMAAYIYAKGIRLSGAAKKSAKLVAAITAVQVGLGIVTLLLQAPEGLAAFHQVVAATLFCAAIWHAYELRYT